MWRNYWTVAVRALAKNKTYSLLNIAGLVIGMAACITILQYVRYETSYDSWMPGAERAYQLQDFYRPTSSGGEPMALQLTSYASTRALLKDFPQIEKGVYMVDTGAVVLQNGHASAPDNFAYVDGNIFDILQLPFVEGNRRTALDRPNALVLTAREAALRFPHQDPLGKTLTLMTMGMVQDYVVTGVISDLPKNSHLAIGIIARFNPESFFADTPSILKNWGNQQGWFYVRLRPGANAADINRAIPAWKKRNIPDTFEGGVRTNAGDDQDWRLVNIRDVHVGKAQKGAMTPGNDRRTLATFSIIALLILGMAIMNFTNLTTARGAQRAREVALRKVVGATRRQLMVQFLAEAIGISAIAMLFALALVEIALKPLSAFLDVDLSLAYFGPDGALLPAIGLTLFVGFASGLYPAFFLSRFQPAHVLKANRSSAETRGSARLRAILVVLQFAVSIGLIVCTVVIHDQTVFARSIDAGYDHASLIQIAGIGDREVNPLLDTLKHEVSGIEGVKGAATTGIGVDPTNNSVSSVYRPGDPKGVELGTYTVDVDFFHVMRMKLLAGREFSPAVALDDSTTPVPQQEDAERALVKRGVNVVVSETAAEKLGFASPAEAIGKPINAELTAPKYGLVPAIIVGVVKDARFRSIHEPLQPILFQYSRAYQKDLMVRYDGAEPARVMGSIGRLWARLIPTIPFKADFVDDRLRRLYDRDEARAQLFAAFSLLAVVISCLGLFGLAAFNAQRRTKEIGIRKVVGAGTRDIVRLLVWQFSRPVIIANVIAWPIAWWLMRDWLNGFDERIALTPAPFVMAGMIALGIAVTTVAGHAIKVARTNPIHALRYE